MMRKVWAVLGFVGRWLGPALIVLAAYLLVFPPGPFGDPPAGLAFAGAVVSLIACILMRAPARQRYRQILAIVAVAAFTFSGWRQWEEKQGYREEIVSFDNRGARLVGTLYLPDRPGKVPGIVWVHGSGPMTRSWLASQVIHFARSGYAVLVYDKRGIGDSTGRFEGGDHAVSPANIDLLASDASAALSLLAGRPEVRADEAGFVGVSQAGWIVPRAAVLNGHAAFVLLLSGPTTSTYTQMRYERFHIGKPPPDEPPSLLMSIKAFGQGNIPDGLTPDQADVLAQKTASDLPYADYDPVTDLRALDIPGLWLLGDRDWMVPSGPTARNLDTLRKVGKPYQYRNIPGAIHGMVIAPKKLVLDTMDEWLRQVTQAKR